MNTPSGHINKSNISDSLYKNPRYPFLEFHRELLGENLCYNDIIGIGTQAIIIQHPQDKDSVIKIALGHDKDSIDEEYNNHLLFFKHLAKGKKMGKIYIIDLGRIQSNL